MVYVLPMHDLLHSGDDLGMFMREVSLAADVFLDQKQIHRSVRSRSVGLPQTLADRLLPRGQPTIENPTEAKW